MYGNYLAYLVVSVRPHYIRTCAGCKCRSGYLTTGLPLNDLYPRQFLYHAHNRGIIEFSHARVDHLLEEFCVLDC